MPENSKAKKDERPIAFAGFLKTSLLPLRECLVLLAVSTIPLLLLEAWKAFNRKSA